GDKWWGFSLGAGMALAAFASLTVLFSFALLDALLVLPRAALAGLFAAWAALSLALVTALVVRLRRGPRSLAATARRIEIEFPEVGSHLINLVQLADTDGEDGDFRRAAVAQAAAAVRHVPFERAARGGTRWRRLRLGLNTPRDFGEACVALVGVLVLAGL